MTEGQVALWYVRLIKPEYEFFDTEEAAAQQAVFMMEYEFGSPMGVQFSDGRRIKLEQWEAYQTARLRFEETIIGYRRSRVIRPKKTTRTIHDPFHGLTLHVDVDAPEWLGK